MGSSRNARSEALASCQEKGTLVCETQYLWPAFDPCRKYGTDCRACGRVSCPGCGAIGTLDHGCRRRHGRGMGPPLFLLPCHHPLGCRTNSRHSLRFLHSWRNRESRRLARRSPVVVRTSSFSWSADGEGLDATRQPDGQSDHVVSGSDLFRRCPNPGRALGMARGRAVEQAVPSVCAVLGGRNVGQQLEEPHGRLCQGPARPRQAMRSTRIHHTELMSNMGFQAAQPWLSTTSSRPLKPTYCQRWSLSCAAVELLRRIQTDS